MPVDLNPFKEPSVNKSRNPGRAKRSREKSPPPPQIEEKGGFTEALFGNCKADIPIRYKGTEIGRVSVAFEASDTFFGPAIISNPLSSLRPEDKMFISRAMAIFRFFDYLKEVMESDLQISLKYELEEERYNALTLLVYVFYYPKESKKGVPKGKPLRLYAHERDPFLIQDEKIFDMIVAEGLQALRQGSVQYALESWLRNEETANEKMGKLKDALIKSEFGTLDKPFKPGRPKAKAVQTTDETWIKDMYKEITEVLKIAKRRAVVLKKDLAGDRLTDEDKKYLSEIHDRIRDTDFTGSESDLKQEEVPGTYEGNPRPTSLKPREAAEHGLRTKMVARKQTLYEGARLYDFIDDAYAGYLSQLKKRQIDTADSAEKRKTEDRIDRLNLLRQRIRFPGNPISDTLRYNPDLEDEFRKLKFQPNKLGKEIVAELLRMSVSKLEKLLY